MSHDDSQPTDRAAAARPLAEEAAENEIVTERKLERSAEDEQFVPVIVKRTDEARRHPDDVLQAAIQEGDEQLQRQPLSLFLSAITAGLILGFTAMSVAIAHEITAPLELPLITRLAKALVYPLGFVVCIMSGTELFTEHTATAVYPVLDRRQDYRRLFRLWGVVLAGNLCGAAASAGLLTGAESVVDFELGIAAVGAHLVEPAAAPLFVSALLAGWLMALGAWLTLGTPPGLAQIASVYIVTFLIGLGGLHHSIAGAAELFSSIFITGEPGWGEGLRFLAVAVVGNLVGGSFFVAVLNYGHIRQSQSLEDET